MRYLMDTHVLLWWFGGKPLSNQAVEILRDAGSDTLVSVASIWEMSIKQAQGRLEVPPELGEAITSDGFDVLPIQWAHARRVSQLPDHHGDPFDRMLVAQALVEDCTIISRDQRVLQYDVPSVQA